MMFPVDYLIVMTMLSASPETPVVAQQATHHELIGPVLQQVAISWEIMDHREKLYVLTRKEDFDSDLQLLRKRYHDLVDAPPIHDCHRFPTRKAISRMLSFNREHSKHLKERLAIDRTRAWLYQEALTETERLYKIWDTIRDTRCEYYYVTVRRQALKKVRDTIGMVKFYNGVYPPHIPTWRFQLID